MQNNNQNSLEVNNIIQILEKHDRDDLKSFTACLEVLQSFGIEYKPINALAEMQAQANVGENKCIGFLR